MNPSILVPMRRASLVVVALAVLTAAVPFGSQGQPPPVPPPGGRGGRSGEPPASTGTGVIVGTVVDGSSGRPVPGAIVALGGRFPQQPAPVVVGSDGRFVFRDLPAGLFSLPVSKNGYLDSNAGRTSPTGMARPVELRDGDRIGDVVLRLWRHAVVSGNAVDDRGEPVVGLRVALLQRAVVNGQLSLEERQTTRTDDRGWYRFTKVAPGRYVVAGQQDPEGFMQAAVMAMSADLTAIMSIMASAFSGVAQFPEVDFRARVIPMVFAPGVATADEAATIALASGDERTGVVIRAARVPTYRVSGTVTGPEAMPPNLRVQLTAPSQMNLPAGVNLGEAGRGGSGRFDFIAIPPGRYVLRAVAMPREAGGRGGRGGGRGGEMASPAPDASTWWATQEITIVDRDEVGLALALREGVRISGRLQFEGTTSAPPAERFSVMAINVDGAAGSQSNVPSSGIADGSFRTIGLPPGRYSVGLVSTPRPWRLRSVRAGGRDVTDVPLDVDADDISDVVIALTDQPLASLSGTVRRLRGDADATAVVFIFPVDRDLWSHVGPTARRFRTVHATDGGRYSLPGLPEGDYYVIAAHEDRLTEWLHPQVLETFASTAGRVQLRDGEQRTLDLTRNDR